MLHTQLQIIDFNLCLVDKTDNNILKIHYPFLEKVMDFKSANIKIIIPEKIKDDQNKSNIYCLDTDFNLVWFSELPFENDKYPNPILWDKKFNLNSWDNFYSDNSNVFTTASTKGVTVSIDYMTGKIEKSILTK